jgi:hypothetical protein
MKTVFLVIVLSLLIGYSSFSQVRFGLKAGTSFTNVAMHKMPDTFNSDVQLAYHAGVFGSLPLSERISIGADLLYSNKGYRNYNEGYQYPDLYFYERFQYLSIPLMLNYELVDKLTVGIGPEVGFLLAASATIEDNWFDTSTLYNNPVDVGLNLGSEYTINERLITGARYYYGFSNVIGDLIIYDENGQATNGAIRNRVFQLYLGYFLKKG